MSNSTKRIVDHEEHFWSKVRKGAGCWLWTAGKYGAGYGRFHIRRHAIRASRAAWLFTYGVIPRGLHVLHTCDNPLCVNPAHLFLGTHRDNMRDMAIKKRAKTPDSRGERNGRMRLTDAQVREIRERIAAGEKQRDLAAEYGVAQATISYVKRKRDCSDP
jgi:hypothetical protein